MTDATTTLSRMSQPVTKRVLSGYAYGTVTVGKFRITRIGRIAQARRGPPNIRSRGRCRGPTRDHSRSALGSENEQRERPTLTRARLRRLRTRRGCRATCPTLRIRSGVLYIFPERTLWRSWQPSGSLAAHARAICTARALRFLLAGDRWGFLSDTYPDVS